MSLINEATLENYCLEYFRTIGYQTAYGPDILPDGSIPCVKMSPAVFAAGGAERPRAPKSNASAFRAGRGLYPAYPTVRAVPYRP